MGDLPIPEESAQELLRLAERHELAKEGWLAHALDDLCQPLTALECLLYVHQDPLEDDSLKATLLRRVMQEALVEVSRITDIVRAMQLRSAGTVDSKQGTLQQAIEIDEQSS